MRVRLILFTFCTLAAALVVLIAPAALTAQACGSSVRHTVQAGENLFRISLRYETTMSAIASANGIGNVNVLYAGQTLTIPCASGGSGYSAAATPTPDGVLPPVFVTPGVSLAPIVVDCTRLRITSPDGLNYGATTFYWDPVAGATSYRVNIYGVDFNQGQRLQTLDVNGNLSRATGDTGQVLGNGFRFQFDVQALVSDIPVCTTARRTVWRAAPDFYGDMDDTPDN